MFYLWFFSLCVRTTGLFNKSWQTRLIDGGLWFSGSVWVGEEGDNWTLGGLRTESAFIKIQETTNEQNSKTTMRKEEEEEAKNSTNVSFKRKNTSTHVFVCTCVCQSIFGTGQSEIKTQNELNPWTWRQVIYKNEDVHLKKNNNS